MVHPPSRPNYCFVNGYVSSLSSGGYSRGYSGRQTKTLDGTPGNSQNTQNPLIGSLLSVHTVAT